MSDAFSDCYDEGEGFGNRVMKPDCISECNYRKLDETITVQLGYGVMRWSNYPEREGVIIRNLDGEWCSEKIPHWSTDGNCMIELHMIMRNRGYKLRVFDCTIDGVDYFHIDYYKNKMYYIAMGHTEAFARAKAVYKALTGNSWIDKAEERVRDE